MAEPKSPNDGDPHADPDRPPAEGAEPHADDAPRRPSPLRRRSVRIGGLVALLVLLVAGGVWLFHWWTVGRYIEKTDDAYLRADAVTIAPKVGGYVDAVLVADNQDVARDQPLVRIDARDYRAQVAQARAQIDSARANAEGVRAQIGEQAAAIAQARAQLAAAEDAAAFARREFARYAPLAESGAETKEQLAAKRNQAEQAAADVAARRASLASAERRVATLRAQVRQAEAQGESAAAQLAADEVTLQSTVLTASIAGRIGDQTVRVGQYVQPGTRLMSVVPLDRLYLVANFKETQIGRMRPGQPATIHVDALPGVDLRGRVDSISPGTGAQFSLLPPQNATGNFTKIVQRVPVRIALATTPDVRRVLVPGLSVTVDVDTIDAKDDASRMAHESTAAKGAPR